MRRNDTEKENIRTKSGGERRRAFAKQGSTGPRTEEDEEEGKNGEEEGGETEESRARKKRERRESRVEGRAEDRHYSPFLSRCPRYCLALFIDPWVHCLAQGSRYNSTFDVAKLSYRRKWSGRALPRLSACDNRARFVSTFQFPVYRDSSASMLSFYSRRE